MLAWIWRKRICFRAKMYSVALDQSFHSSLPTMMQVLRISFVLTLSPLCLQLVSGSDPQHRHTAPRQNVVRHIHPRAICKTASVESGDSCATLAERCQLSATDFTKYNNDPKLCSSLQPGQRVCCSEGVLPDISPKPQLDGSCSTHNVTDGENCSVIAGTLGIKTTDIDSWNKQTWRYSGCDGLEAGQVICVSEGSPPMPIPLENAICGPQMPGTQKPTNLSQEGALSELNPCPLKACCNIWGQCGTTDDYCTPTKLENGAPGASAPGENACISNCGMEIVKSDPPKNVISIGYFEAFNIDRPCLVMDASQIPGKDFTHIHFAFANISHDYKLQLAGSTAAQWSIFKDISGPKRILSFGGWSFSTSVDSFPIFGKAVSKENRQTFIDSLVQFVSNSGVDGLDFDWEYPGAPDLPGVPSGDAKDGERYLDFLKDLRAALPKDRSLSIAAPASYWYLKAFPIAEMAEVLDYIVYMTYDLHGQWDYNNKYSSSGCPKGDCLRSHVNLTETNTAL
ncbi:hypothetical protein AC578_4004 [Pseudocercospora eumusae]|uniref:chitinase n=1 Tax=Pseudocercospora eumusae TaxID=321146 RepID=A0A139HLE5_9PEZI|nr:hypothetical protein AC578_4004 [Pseudocercospora eumusae]